MRRVQRSQRTPKDYLALIFTIEGQRRVRGKLRALYLRRQLAKEVAKGNLRAVLEITATHERSQHIVGIDAGRMIAEHLITTDGRNTLLAAADQAQKRIPDSIYLLSLIALCRALAGEYRQASDTILQISSHPFEGPDQLTKRRISMLQFTWRAVDLIARGNMDWASEVAGYDDVVFGGSLRATTGQDLPTEVLQRIVADPARRSIVKECALQGRHRDAYLQICQSEFELATTLKNKLNTIQDMLAVGKRHVPEYVSNFRLASECLSAISADVQNLFSEEALHPTKSAKNTLKSLCSLLKLADLLNHSELKAQTLNYLITLSTRDDLLPALWLVPATLEKETENSQPARQLAMKLVTQTPGISQDLLFFFRWAALSHEYELAEQVYQTLPKTMGRPRSLLEYANILQCQGRFTEALQVVRDVHGQLLANPSLANGMNNFSLIKRTGELEFLIKTAALYQSVPQPQNPDRVIMVACRNIDQLRRYPIMPLLEFKRRGWAVVPLVEGLLPLESTGRPEIDVIAGALTPQARLTPAAAPLMPKETDVIKDTGQGRFVWKGLDLSHQLWEDAAINRRRYTVDYACPELQRYLGNLVSWTDVMGRVMNYAHEQHQTHQLQIGNVSQFSSRLPDGIFRKYCDAFGDADGFFHLAAANGYQNYFTNFSTNVSQRFVLRNMTRHATLRSPSFPIPENFERYYQDKHDELPAILDRFAATPKVKRSTAGQSGRPPEADALDVRINRWRDNGGKVVCAFGKVVCDIGVPFDGGPAHRNMKEWINHAIRTVQGSNTLLLIKPHPHEVNDHIATFPTEFFKDLIEEPLGENAVMLGHRWFDIYDMKNRIDAGLIYNGTTAIELGLLNIPCVLSGHFGPIDYPIGHVVAKDRKEFEDYLRFDRPLTVASDLKQRAAMWLDYMANENFTQPYRYHVRPVTNKLIYPPYWFEEDLRAYQDHGDPAVVELVGRALGERPEPGADWAAPDR